MSMPKRLGVGLICTLLAASVGCGGGDAESTDPEESSVSTSNEASTALTRLTAGEGAGKEVVSMESGLHYVDLREGAGDPPQPGQTCSTHATLWLLDGTRIWSSRDDGEPFDFALGGGGVIAGWDEGVATMRPGGIRRLAVPPELGYGAAGRPPVPPNATLIFEIELLSIQ